MLPGYYRTDYSMLSYLKASIRQAIVPPSNSRGWWMLYWSGFTGDDECWECATDSESEALAVVMKCAADLKKLRGTLVRFGDYHDSMNVYRHKDFRSHPDARVLSGKSGLSLVRPNRRLALSNLLPELDWDGKSSTLLAFVTVAELFDAEHDEQEVYHWLNDASCSRENYPPFGIAVFWEPDTEES